MASEPSADPIPDDLLDTLAKRMAERRSGRARFKGADALDVAIIANVLHALASWADGHLIDPDGWRRVRPTGSDLRPGTVMLSDNGGRVVLSHRKDDDSGWWNTDGSGLADFVIESGAWQPLTPAPEEE